METTKEEWQRLEREWARKIVSSINAVREYQGLTVKELGVRLDTLGWPVSTATLSGILSGDKRGSISVAEVSMFARALSVTPIYLILGLPNSSEMPDYKAWPHPDIYWFYSWFTGPQGALYSGDNDSLDDATSMAASLSTQFLYRTNQLSRFIWDEIARLAALAQLEHLETEWRAAKVQAAKDVLIGDLTSLRRLRTRQRENAAEVSLADIPRLPLPAGLEFVDTNSSISDCVDSLYPDEVSVLASPHSIVKATRRIEELHDKRLTNRDSTE